MRISDWSSDVCSSDLGGASPLADTRIDGGARHGGNRIGAETRPRLRRVQRLEPERAERFGLEADGAVDHARPDRGHPELRGPAADQARVTTPGPPRPSNPPPPRTSLARGHRGARRAPTG